VAGDKVEDDHFPIPKRAGGTEVVPACITCHDMKDRFPQEDWPKKLLEKAQDEIKKYIRAEAQLTGPSNPRTSDDIAPLINSCYSWPQHVLKNWSENSREARLLAAKWLALDACPGNDRRLEG
jgi:hypothetical protein